MELSIDESFTMDSYGNLSVIHNNGLLFEVACRVKNADCALGSTYKTLNETKCDVFGTGKLAFAEGPSAKPRFAILFSSPNRIICANNQSLHLSPNEKLTNQFPYTIEWRYEVMWSLK